MTGVAIGIGVGLTILGLLVWNFLDMKKARDADRAALPDKAQWKAMNERMLWAEVPTDKELKKKMPDHVMSSLVYYSDFKPEEMARYFNVPWTWMDNRLRIWHDRE